MSSSGRPGFSRSSGPVGGNEPVDTDHVLPDLLPGGEHHPRDLHPGADHHPVPVAVLPPPLLMPGHSPASAGPGHLMSGMSNLMSGPTGDLNILVTDINWASHVQVVLPSLGLVVQCSISNMQGLPSQATPTPTCMATDILHTRPTPTPTTGTEATRLSQTLRPTSHPTLLRPLYPPPPLAPPSLPSIRGWGKPSPADLRGLPPSPV